MSKNPPTANDTSRRKIEYAARGAKTNFQQKLGMVIDYVMNQAATKRCAVADVPCPDAHEWAILASGRGGVLPSETQLGLFATENMRKLASRVGLRRAYFAVAKYRIEQTQKK